MGVGRDERDRALAEEPPRDALGRLAVMHRRPVQAQRPPTRGDPDSGRGVGGNCGTPLRMGEHRTSPSASIRSHAAQVSPTASSTWSHHPGTRPGRRTSHPAEARRDRRATPRSGTPRARGGDRASSARRLAASPRMLPRSAARAPASTETSPTARACAASRTAHASPRRHRRARAPPRPTPHARTRRRARRATTSRCRSPASASPRAARRWPTASRVTARRSTRWSAAASCSPRPGPSTAARRQTRVVRGNHAARQHPGRPRLRRLRPEQPGRRERLRDLRPGRPLPLTANVRSSVGDRGARRAPPEHGPPVRLAAWEALDHKGET
jgi:hypothetical protein